MGRIFGVYGSSGCGRDIMPLVRAMPQAVDAEIVFIDDGASPAVVNGHTVMAWPEFQALEGEKKATIAISDSRIRRLLAEKCIKNGISLFDVRADNAVIMDDVALGAGAILSPFVTLTCNIRIGMCFHANLYSSVSHDCVIGDYVTFAPGVRCNGNVTIEDNAYIGSGAVIRQGIRIGAGATVGMGAVVTKDVAAATVVAGNPARVLEQRRSQ